MKKLLFKFIISLCTIETLVYFLYEKITEVHRLRLDEKQKTNLAYHFFGLVKELKRLKKIDQN